MTELNTLASVADVLERELQPTIREWLCRVNLIPELTDIPLSDADRTGHLFKLYHDLISRLRLPRGFESPVSVAAAEHGKLRHAQGYSPSMLIEESRLIQVATFRTLHLHYSELDPKQVLADVLVIADEVDAQLMETVRSLVDEASRERDLAMHSRTTRPVKVVRRLTHGPSGPNPRARAS